MLSRPPSLYRCEPSDESHDSSSVISSALFEPVVGSPELPPKMSELIPTVPSGRSDPTRTRPSGVSEYGLASLLFTDQVARISFRKLPPICDVSDDASPTPSVWFWPLCGRS